MLTSTTNTSTPLRVNCVVSNYLTYLVLFQAYRLHDVHQKSYVLFIVFDAKDERGVAKVELLWNANGRTTVYRCGDLPEDLPIECGRAGDRFAFALQVGAGERTFAIRVTDTAGNAATTRWRRASFDEPEVDVDVWAQSGGQDYGDCG